MRYKIEGKKLYIHWSLHLTQGYLISESFDGEGYITFDDEVDAELFASEVAELTGNDEPLERHPFGSWDDTAIKVSDITDVIDISHGLKVSA